MGSPLPDSEFLNGRTAIQAGLAGLLIDPEMILKLAATIKPIQAGTGTLDAFVQYRPDCPVQLACFCFRERLRFLQRVEFGPE